jgi:glucosamine--fructose-6-phosphate aminotransferase (isomerizing)
MVGEWMEREIQDQVHLLPDVIGSYEQQLAPLKARSFEIVLLAARGSSDHAALYARYLIEIHLRIPAQLVAPSVLTRYGAHVRYPRALVVGISQSGSAPDVAEVIAEARRQGHTTLAVTNTEGSRLHQEAEHALLLQVGPEKSVAATKTYSASLLALYQLVRALGAALPAPRLPDLDWLQGCRDLAERHAETLCSLDPVFALGRGYAFATANEAALKLMECALLPCKAYSTADFEHGPKALATTGSALIAFGPISPALAAQGGTILAAPASRAPEEIEPLWDILYGQWLALIAARLRGHDPDQPQFIQKVTKTL